MGRAVQYTITLTEEERNHLRELLRGGVSNARVQTRARILLLADQKKGNKEIAESLFIGRDTVWRTRLRFSEGGLKAALYHKTPANYRPHRLDGRGEARLVQLACSSPPEGHARWTLELLTDRLIELQVVPSVCKETVRKTLKKTNCRLT